MSYTFAAQNAVGKVAEEITEQILTNAGIAFERNPATGTDDPSRADYDHRLQKFLIEEKYNLASKETGNIALEIDILERSKAHYFWMWFYRDGLLDCRVLDRNHLYNLLTATKLTKDGRFYRYLRLPTGQLLPDGYRKVSALIPVPDVMLTGIPLDYFIKTLKQQQ